MSGDRGVSKDVGSEGRRMQGYFLREWFPENIKIWKANDYGLITNQLHFLQGQPQGADLDIN
jgi:hypothetical protein